MNNNNLISRISINSVKALAFTTMATLSILLLSSALQASESEAKNHEVIVLKKQSADGTMTNLELDSNISGVILHELADGESKSITSKSGELVTVSRSGDELHVLSKGEEMILPYMHDKNGANIKIIKMEDGGMENMDVDIEMKIPDGLTITSSRELDKTTQEKIRAAIASAGLQDAVHFSNGPHIIRKEIIMPEGSEMTDMHGMMGDLEGADIQEFTTEDGKHIKIVKKRMDIGK